jgi:predicted small lipoprotein YifL
MKAGGMRAVFLLAALALLLGGCGRKGWPLPEGPPDQVTFPRVYPTH